MEERELNIEEQNNNTEEVTEEQETNEGNEQNVIIPDTEDVPEKFRGKPITEVVKSYSEMEKILGKLGSVFGGDKKEEQANALQELFSERIRPDMTPVEFASTVAEVVEKRAKEIAEQIVSETTEKKIQEMTMEQKMAAEVEEVKKKFPEIESDQEFQDLALWIVDRKGVGLMEAATEAKKLLAKENRDDTIEPDTLGSTTTNEEDPLGLGGATGGLPGLV